MTATSASTLAIVAARAGGRLSVGMAAMRLLLVHRDVEGTCAGLAAVNGDPAASSADRTAAAELLDLLRGRSDAADRVVAIAAEADALLAERTGDAAAGVESCRRLFDWAVTVDPAASVALYSLGTEKLLEETANEIAGYLVARGLVGTDRRVLDLGCGIGRLERALAGRVAAITGVDASAAMVAEARRRCVGLPGVELAATSGRDLRLFADGSFDTVLAVDSFPYFYQAGGPAFAAAQFAEAVRVTRPGGDILALNLSYRGDVGLDRADAAAFARASGAELLCAGVQELALWDGGTFHWRRSA